MFTPTQTQFPENRFCRKILPHLQLLAGWGNLVVRKTKIRRGENQSSESIHSEYPGKHFSDLSIDRLIGACGIT